MIIDEPTKVIFLHNPKCGGTFFRQVHYNSHRSGVSTVYWKLYEQEVNADLGHINLHNLARFVPDYREYRIMTFVRNLEKTVKLTP